MGPRHLETAELFAFIKIVDCGSVSRAAAELGAPRATLGSKLSMLERRIGKRLLRRTTRSQVLTDAGRELYPHARSVVEAVERAEASITAGEPGVLRGAIRVSVPAAMPPSFAAFSCDFMLRHPEVRLQVHCSNRVVDLRRDGYDIALRAARDLEPGIVARTLFRDNLVAVAAPTYLATWGVPRSKRDLVRHRVVVDFSGDDQPQTNWPSLGASTFHVEPVLSVNSRAILHEAVSRGLGIAVLPSMDVRAALAAGELVHVLKGVVRGEVRIVIAYPERDLIAPHVRAFAEALAEWALSELGARTAGAPAAVGSTSKRRR